MGKGGERAFGRYAGGRRESGETRGCLTLILRLLFCTNSHDAC